MINNLKQQGYNQSQIANMMGISRQRISQILSFEKHNARAALSQAIKRGKLIKPLNCTKCLSNKELHGHHNDYSLPLEVVWLCTECHGQEHTSPIRHGTVRGYRQGCRCDECGDARYESKHGGMSRQEYAQANGWG